MTAPRVLPDCGSHPHARRIIAANPTTPSALAAPPARTPLPTARTHCAAVARSPISGDHSRPPIYSHTDGVPPLPPDRWPAPVCTASSPPIPPHALRATSGAFGGCASEYPPLTLPRRCHPHPHHPYAGGWRTIDTTHPRCADINAVPCAGHVRRLCSSHPHLVCHVCAHCVCHLATMGRCSPPRGATAAVRLPSLVFPAPANTLPGPSTRDL